MPCMWINVRHTSEKIKCPIGTANKITPCSFSTAIIIWTMKYFKNRQVSVSTAKGYILIASFLSSRLNWVPPPKPPKVATKQITRIFRQNIYFKLQRTVRSHSRIYNTNRNWQLKNKMIYVH